MTIKTVAEQECHASAVQNRLFDTFPAREVKLGSFSVMRPQPNRDENE